MLSFEKFHLYLFYFPIAWTIFLNQLFISFMNIQKYVLPQIMFDIGFPTT